MKKQNIIQEKSIIFANEIIKLYKVLKAVQEYDLARQVLRSGTSIGANIEESIAAQSKKDFLSKVSIALKETRETNYWLRLFEASQLLPSKFYFLKDDSLELMSIMSSIVKTLKEQLKIN